MDPCEEGLSTVIVFFVLDTGDRYIGRRLFLEIAWCCMAFPGGRCTNVHSPQIGPQGQNKEITPPKSSLVEQ